jgi:hypothetical protein
MTTKTRRQVAVLAVLLVALAVVTWMRSGQPAPAATAARPSNPVSGTTGRRTQASPQAPVADVKLEALTAPRDDAAAPTERNLFRFREKAPPPAPPREATALPPPRPVQPEPIVPTGPPPPPPIPLRLIGLLNAPTQAGRVAVFSDGRGNSLNGREGDIIEGRYRLLRINADSVELAYTDGRGRQVIRLAGQ